MACRITDVCTACGICIGQCVNEAVYVTAENLYAINPERCTECIDQPHRRCHSICSVGAILPDPTRRETPQELWARHRALRAARLSEDQI